jgi:hypothetical protein
LDRRAAMLVLGLALVLPRAARAQQKTMPVIGFLHFGSPGPFTQQIADFHQGLAETGYVDAQNVVIEYRWADGFGEFANRRETGGRGFRCLRQDQRLVVGDESNFGPYFARATDCGSVTPARWRY